MTDETANPPTYDELVARARTERWVERLHDRDASLWSSDPEVQATIAERLGWLDAPVHFHEEIGPLEAFGEAVRDAGYRRPSWPGWAAAAWPRTCFGGPSATAATG